MNPMLAAIEESFSIAHDNIVNRLILESLLKNGSVNIEEAKFFKDYAERILHESSHLFIPDRQELHESLAEADASSKILIDPETGEQYVYNMSTGELTPTSADYDENVGSEDLDGGAGMAGDAGMAGGDVLTDSTLNENEILVGKLLETLKN